jgi:serine phosphatase RsbU (regulator of sigma subunit)
VNATTPDYLRLYRESLPTNVEDRSLLGELDTAFQQVTGTSLETVLTTVAQRLDTKVIKSVEPRSTKDQAVHVLGTLIGKLWEELEQTRAALRSGEAELATNVPVIARRRDGEQLADRFESVLRGGAAVVGAQSAAVYLLDAGTTHLKLRTQWNLPLSRLADPARALAGATADLEAMCGHAVVLDDPAMMQYWNVPETCGAAVCLPISSATTILGTMWIFADQPRAFSDAEINMLEIVAGRMAAELERELLVAKGAETAKLEKQLDLAAKIQEQQLPQVAPLLDDWQVAGVTEQLQRLGGDFHDWHVTDDERLMVAVADCLDGGVDASLCAAAVRATWRAVANDVQGPDEILARINHQMWCGSTGDQYAHLFVAFADPRSGRVRYSIAGSPTVLLLEKNQWRSLVEPTLALGVDIEQLFTCHELTLTRGQSLVTFTNGVLDALDERGRSLDLAKLGQWLVKHPQASAGQLVDLVRDFLETHCRGPKYDDRTILALRRR